MGMLINFAVSVTVSHSALHRPRKWAGLVENIRVWPKGSGAGARPVSA